jgi:hypothetical protein
MKLYHYAPKVNTVKEQGLLSISKGPRDLRAYAHRAGSENREDIMAWLDKTFAGRSRAISCLTEPIKWQGNDAVLKAIVERSALFSFELNDLIKAGIVEAIWCKNGSDAGGYNEKFYLVKPEDIDLSPLTWEKVDAAKDLLYAVVRHYLIVLKDGCIPPQYLTLEG